MSRNARCYDGAMPKQNNVYVTQYNKNLDNYKYFLTILNKIRWSNKITTAKTEITIKTRYILIFNCINYNNNDRIT